jgi:hypothetical protein
MGLADLDLRFCHRRHCLSDVLSSF